MTVGYSQGRADIDQKAGSVALGIRQSLDSATAFKTFLDGKSDSDLTDLGFSEGDVTLLRAAMVDLAKLAQIARGQATQANASDFYWNAKHLTGVI